ncbi:MAG TPA: lipoyl synthase [candidate division Zixibacteria bacterium]|nr:lipoyl synthase [candidate division Zixibacteria bacterium]
MRPYERKPPWLKVSAFRGQGFNEVTRRLKELGLNTVCQAANCPNRGECFNRGTATFLIMGPVCSRNCTFCDIQGGKPHPLDPTEPQRVGLMAAELKLKHVVVTSVTRDDLPDGGADHFARTVAEIRRAIPSATVELLTPDFRGSTEAPDIIIAAAPDVFNHNVETVPRLYKIVRPGADYQRSLALLDYIGRTSGIPTKSGLMVGLGETPEELQAVFEDLARIGVVMLTIGQYLRPSMKHQPVFRYVTPEEFDVFGKAAEAAGIKRVFSAPLVRSSYMAEAL